MTQNKTGKWSQHVITSKVSLAKGAWKCHVSWWHGVIGCGQGVSGAKLAYFCGSVSGSEL